MGRFTHWGARLRRYWIDQKYLDKALGKVYLEGDVFHHICGVCRQEVGSKFEVLADDSCAYFVEIVELSKKSAVAEIKEAREIAPLKEPHIHLAVSLPRFQKMDEIIEKAVEMGVAEVHPFVSDFSFVRKASKVSESKIQRWDKIVRSATQQCGRGELMKVQPIRTLDELLKSFNQSADAAGLFPYEGESRQTLPTYLKGLKNQSFKQVWAFVGSEGGFSDREVELFSEYNLQTVTLGQQVLRVETACLAITAVIKYELGLME